jgi:hypothetical protein
MRHSIATIPCTFLVCLALVVLGVVALALQ